MSPHVLESVGRCDPGQGKSFAARLAALACALDPTCELHIFDLKGGADWLCFDPIAHAIGIGDQPGDIEFLIHDLRAVRTEMQRRYARAAADGPGQGSTGAGRQNHA